MVLAGSLWFCTVCRTFSGIFGLSSIDASSILYIHAPLQQTSLDTAEALVLLVTADRAYEEVICLESGHRGGPQSERTGVLVRRGLDMVVHPWNTSTSLRQGDDKFKTSLNYI